MATARKITPEPVPPPPNVVLELTYAEARVLRTLVHLTGGNPDTSGRKHANAVARALDSVGVAPLATLGADNVIEPGSQIYFVPGRGA